MEKGPKRHGYSIIPFKAHLLNVHDIGPSLPPVFPVDQPAHWPLTRGPIKSTILLSPPLLWLHIMWAGLYN